MDSTRRNLVIGLSAISAGSIGATLTTSTGRALSMAITVSGSNQPFFALPENFSIIDIGDSLRAAGRAGVSTLLRADTTNLGGLERTRAQAPVFNYDLYPRDTSAIETGYGAVEYTWGSNLGYAGSPIDYVIGLLPKITAMAPDTVYWGPTINSVRDGHIVAKINQVVSVLRAAGIRIFLRTLPSVAKDSTFHTPSGDPTGAQYVAGYSAINNEIARIAAANPTQIRLVDLRPVFDIPGTPFRKPNQTWDGTHNSALGSAIEAKLFGSIVKDHVPANTNVILARWNRVANLVPNHSMGGTGGSRSGIVAYAGPGFSIPSGYAVRPSGAVASTATVAVEANPDRGGFGFTGSIAKTTLTVTATDGVLKPGMRIGGGSGRGALNDTVIMSQLTSTAPGRTLGGRGTYQVQSHSTAVASAAMIADAQRLALTVTPGGAATYEKIEIITNPTLISNTAVQGKYIRGGAEVELAGSGIWDIPYLSLTDNTSNRKSFAYKYDTNSGVIFDTPAGKQFIETNSILFDEAAAGATMLLGLAFNPQAAGGQPFKAYVSFLHIGESVDPHIAYPAA